jgi:hypothetical protein
LSYGAAITIRARALGQMTVIGAIVATMLYFPVGIALVIVLHFAGIGFEALCTFGGRLGMATGIAAWWLIFFAGGLVYAACFFPWSDEVPGWPRKK